MGIVRDGNSPGWELTGGNCPGWELSGMGNIRDGNCPPGGNCPGWELSGMGIVQESHETVIVDSNLNFNVICISETSQRESAMFCNNIDLKHYHTPISTDTKTAKGGTAIYVLKDHDSIEWYDLKTCNIEYESTWVEIINIKSKNIIIGCIYRQ